VCPVLSLMEKRVTLEKGEDARRATKLASQSVKAHSGPQAGILPCTERLSVGYEKNAEEKKRGVATKEQAAKPGN